MPCGMCLYCVRAAGWHVVYFSSDTVDMSAASSRSVRQRIMLLSLAACAAFLLSSCSADRAASAPDAACSFSGPWGPETLVKVWECELTSSGVDDRSARDLAVKALVVAHCESGWNPSVSYFAGRFSSVPNPSTGRVHSEAGVFLLTREEAEEFMDGGYARVFDPVENTRAAAKIFLEAAGGPDAVSSGSYAEVAWGRWPCHASVLPHPVGAAPSLPSWAAAYSG